MTFEILSEPYLRNCKLKEVDLLMGRWLGSVGMLNHGVTFLALSSSGPAS